MALSGVSSVSAAIYVLPYRSVYYVIQRKLQSIDVLIQSIFQAAPRERQFSDSDSAIDISQPEEDKVAALSGRIHDYSDSDASRITASTVGFNTAALDPVQGDHRDQEDQQDKKGQQDDEDKTPHVSEISGKTTAKQFQAGMTQFIDDTGLGCFFAEDDKFLEDVAMKAVELENNVDEVLNSKKDIQDITKLALYQPVFYCGESD